MAEQAVRWEEDRSSSDVRVVHLLGKRGDRFKGSCRPALGLPVGPADLVRVRRVDRVFGRRDPPQSAGCEAAVEGLCDCPFPKEEPAQRGMADHADAIGRTGWGGWRCNGCEASHSRGLLKLRR